jgi:hypothetical protein
MSDADSLKEQAFSFWAMCERAVPFFQTSMAERHGEAYGADDPFLVGIQKEECVSIRSVAGNDLIFGSS